MKLLLLTPIFFSVSYTAFTQNDSVVYINKQGITTTRDSAYEYTLFSKNGNLWHGKTYYAKNNVLQSEGDYSNINVAAPVGSFKNYNEEGKLDNISVYDNGKPTECTYFYKDGNKKSHIVFNGDKITEQKGWDESGKEIPGFIVARQAMFKGGEEGWQKYLQKHLNSNVAADAGLPAGDYIVELEFNVNKDGYISNVKVVNAPAKCKPCTAEAISVITEGANWEPAIFNNEPVVYRLRQKITFNLTDKTKKRGKN
jgi:hypothetical protein